MVLNSFAWVVGGSEEGLPRGRGRPPKIDSPRGRGRPPKNKSAKKGKRPFSLNASPIASPSLEQSEGMDDEDSVGSLDDEDEDVPPRMARKRSVDEDPEVEIDEEEVRKDGIWFEVRDLPCNKYPQAQL